jgi:maltooligosyltrehalose synthase
VELTACLANCASKRKVKEAAPYERVLSLVEQLQPLSVAGTAMNTSGEQQLQQMINTSTARTREDTKCFGAAKGAAFSDLVLLFIESQC